MSNKNVSRRSLVPSLTAGAVGALAVSTPPHAAAAAGRNRVVACGPCKVWPGHNLSFEIFFPATQRSNRAGHFRLIAYTLDGNELVSRDIELTPGTGKEAELAVDADGTVRFDGKVVQAAGPSLIIGPIWVIIITIARSLSPTAAASAGGGAKVQATATSFVPGRAPGEQNVDYILPFIEQD